MKKILFQFIFTISIFTHFLMASPSSGPDSESILRCSMFPVVQRIKEQLTAGTSPHDIMVTSFQELPCEDLSQRLATLDETYPRKCSGARLEAFEKLKANAQDAIQKGAFTAITYKDFIVDTAALLNQTGVHVQYRLYIFDDQEPWQQRAIVIPFMDQTGVLGLQTLFQSFLSGICILPLMLGDIDPIHAPHMTVIQVPSEMTEHDLLHCRDWMHYHHQFQSSLFFTSGLQKIADAVCVLEDKVKMKKYSYVLYDLIHEGLLSRLHLAYDCYQHPFRQEDKTFSQSILERMAKSTPRVATRNFIHILRDMDQYWLFGELGFITSEFSRQQAWELSQCREPLTETEINFLNDLIVKSKKVSKDLLREFVEDYSMDLDSVFPPLVDYMREMKAITAQMRASES